MNKAVENIKFSVIGGDERQIFCARTLAEKGYETSVYGFENYKGDIGLCTRCNSLSDALSGSRFVILGVNPVTCDGNINMPLSDVNIKFADILEILQEKSVIFCGNLCVESVSLARNCAIKIFDYGKREEFLVANAYLTAEGAVKLAIDELRCSLNGINALVIGYGRIGKCLCHILKALGVNVFASARKKKDFAYIRAFGYSDVDTSKICDVVSECSLVFNTVPGLVLGKNELNCMPKDTLIIDLASKPGGVDFEGAKKCGLKVIWALSLPGKLMPVSAGRIVANTVTEILDDEEMI